MKTAEAVAFPPRICSAALKRGINESGFGSEAQTAFVVSMGVDLFLKPG